MVVGATVVDVVVVVVVVVVEVVVVVVGGRVVVVVVVLVVVVVGRLEGVVVLEEEVVGVAVQSDKLLIVKCPGAQQVSVEYCLKVKTSPTTTGIESEPVALFSTVN